MANWIKFSENCKTSDNRTKTAKTIAMKTLAAGPATATIASPHFWLVKLYGLYGTGLAAPNKNGEPVIMSKPGKITDIRGSMCTSGLAERRPWRRAVGSPSQLAA